MVSTKGMSLAEIAKVVCAARELKEYREGRKISQRQAAEEIGISRGQYSKVETGHTHVSGDIYAKIASYYSIKISVEYPIRKK